MVDYQKKVREEQPDIDSKDVMGEVSKKWKDVDEKTKNHYEELAKADGDRKAKQEKELKDKGYFTMEDGTKSNTKENIKKFSPKTKTNKTVVEEEEKPQRKPLKKKTEAPAPKKIATNKKEIEQTDHELNIESESDM